MNLRGVILDMDGTLLDSMPIWHEIDVRFFEENGLTIPEGLSEQVNKMSMEEWAEFFIREFDIAHNTPESVIRRIEEMAAEYYTERIPLKPYVTEFLDALDAKGIPYGVATATYRSSASAALQRLGVLGRMRFLLTAEDVRRCTCGRRPCSGQRPPRRSLSRMRSTACRWPCRAASPWRRCMTQAARRRNGRRSAG